MPIEEFKEASLRLQEEGLVEKPKPLNSFREALNLIRASNIDSLKQSAFVAAPKNPDQHAQVLDISQKRGLPVPAVERNFEKLQKEQSAQTTDFNEIIKIAPGLAKWLQAPDNMAVAKDEIPELANLEQNLNVLKDKPEEDFFTKDLYRSGRIGYHQLSAATHIFAVAFGLQDVESGADDIFNSLEEKEELEAIRNKTYFGELQRQLNENAGDTLQAQLGWLESVDSFQRGDTLEGLKIFIAGGSQYGWNLVSRLSIYPRNLKGTANFLAETLVASSPSLLTGGLIAIPAAAVGTAVGGAGLGALTGRLGYALGSASGELPTEIGNAILEDVFKKGVTTREELAAVLKDPKFMKQIKDRAIKGGLTVTSVDFLYNLALGGKVSKAKGFKQVSIAAVKETGFQAVGGTFAEAAKQVVRGDVDPNEIIDEFMGEIGFGSAEVASTFTRQSLNRNTFKAVKELVVKANDARKNLDDMISLKKASEIVSKSKLNGRSKEKTNQAIRSILGSDKKLFIDFKDFDSYFRERGLSPPSAFERFGGDLEFYNDARETGSALEIPLNNFLTETANTEHANGLLPFLRKDDPDNPNLVESRDIMKGLNPIFDQLAKEAPTELIKDTPLPQDDSTIRIKDTDIFTDEEISKLPKLKKRFKDIQDRLAASDKEVENTSELYTPIAPEEALKGKIGKSILAAEERAKQSARATLDKKLMVNLKKEKQIIIDNERQRLQFEVEREINERPESKALFALQKGTQPDGSPIPASVAELKLHPDALVAEFGKGILNELPKGITSSEIGIDHNVAAPMFGYRNGQELVSGLRTTRNRAEEIMAKTSFKLKEKFGDLLTDPQLSEEAINAFHNDNRSEAIRLKLDYLLSDELPAFKEAIKRITRKIPSNEELRSQAALQIGRTNIGNLSLRKYELAERKNSKLAGQALANGNIELALDHTIKEALSHEIYKQSIKAREVNAQFFKNIKKLNKSDKQLSKTRDLSYINASRALLSRFGLGRDPKNPLNYLELVKQNDPDVYETLSAYMEAITTETKHYKELTFDEMQELKETTDALFSLSKVSNEIEVEGKKIPIDEAVDELVKQQEQFQKKGNKTGFRKSMDNWGKFSKILHSAKAYLRITESWADAMDVGNPEGIHNRVFVKKILPAAVEFRADYSKELDKLKNILEKVDLNTDEIVAPELATTEFPNGYVFRGKMELFGAILHTGNASNKQKLLRGYGWGEIDAQGRLNVTRWNAFVNRMIDQGVLTKKDYDGIQSVWNLFNSLKPRIQTAHKKRYGRFFKEVEAQAFDTPFGRYAGGYVPARADKLEVTSQRIREEIDLMNNNATFSFPTTGDGPTKARVESYAAPLQINLSFLPSHLDWALRFIHLQNPVSEVARAVMRPKFRESMEKINPSTVDEMLIPWLQRTALQKLTTPTGKGAIVGAFDRTASYLRRNSAMNLMMASMVNTVEQFTGIGVAKAELSNQGLGGKRLLLNSMWSYMFNHKEMIAEITEKSPVMAERYTAQMFILTEEIQNLTLDLTKTMTVRSYINRHVYFAQHAMQNVVDTITWSAFYDGSKSSNPKVNTDQQAIDIADKAVRLTQGSATAESATRFATGSPMWRVFAMFVNYWNTQINFHATSTQNIINKFGLKGGAGKLFFLYLFGFMVPAVVSGLIRKGASGKFDEDEDGKYIDDIFDVFFGSQFRYGTGMIPAVGPLASNIVNRFNDKFWDDRMSVSPVFTLLEKGASAPADIYKDILDGKLRKRTVRDTLTLTGLMSGLPFAVAGKPIYYVMDLVDGKARPSGPIDFTRGLITGKPGKTRKTSGGGRGSRNRKSGKRKGNRSKRKGKRR